MTAGQTVAYRVECPLCGAWAQLRVWFERDGTPVPVSLSCREQTEADHGQPTIEQIRDLVTKAV